MELIDKFNNLNEANDLSELLENNGIPSNVNENDLRNRGTHIPEGYEVWIYINSQYPDAVKLIKDKNYIVKDQVNINEFYKEIESKVNNDLLVQYKTKFIIYGIAFIIIVITFILLI